MGYIVIKRKVKLQQWFRANRNSSLDLNYQAKKNVTLCEYTWQLKILLVQTDFLTNVYHMTVPILILYGLHVKNEVFNDLH